MVDFRDVRNFSQSVLDFSQRYALEDLEEELN